jgi:uncharacterized protein (DUF2336 family)
MTLSTTLINELETAVQASSIEKRAVTLQRITDLFLHDPGHLSSEQVDLFDDVLSHLIKRVELKALRELSQRLAPSPYAPAGVLRQLARHDDILVAGPVLAQSEKLTDADLLEIVKTKRQEHLIAVSERMLLSEQLTDVLLERGSKQVFHKLAQNHGAFFSKKGFSTLVNYAKSDEVLAERVGQRLDVPPQLLQELVLKATEAVRKRLLATAPAEVHAEIKRVLAQISQSVQTEVEVEIRDFKRARDHVLSVQRKGLLNESALCEFIRAKKYEELVAGLALMGSARFELAERLMRTLHCGGLLVVCKAAGLQWLTVQLILSFRLPDHPISSHDLEQAKNDYAKLAKATAQRLIEFWQAKPGPTLS